MNEIHLITKGVIVIYITNKSYCLNKNKIRKLFRKTTETTITIITKTTIEQRRNLKKILYNKGIITYIFWSSYFNHSYFRLTCLFSKELYLLEINRRRGIFVLSRLLSFSKRGKQKLKNEVTVAWRSNRKNDLLSGLE